MIPGTLLTAWEGSPVEAWRQDWQLPRLLVLDSTTSTNDVARSLAGDGAPEGTVVIAEAQTAGRGQAGRAWYAPYGSALLMSIVLRAPAGADPLVDPGPTPSRVGLATCLAIADTAGVHARINWPNDIVCQHHKLAGILCEGVSGPDGATVIAGVGINVTQTADDFPQDLRAPPTSLFVITGRRFPRAPLAAAIIDRLRPFHLAGATLDDGAIELFRSLDALAGLDVELNGSAAGIAHGITPDGALILQTATGRRTVRSGSVRARATPEP